MHSFEEPEVVTSNNCNEATMSDISAVNVTSEEEIGARLTDQINDAC